MADHIYTLFRVSLWGCYYLGEVPGDSFHRTLGSGLGGASNRNTACRNFRSCTARHIIKGLQAVRRSQTGCLPTLTLPDLLCMC